MMFNLGLLLLVAIQIFFILGQELSEKDYEKLEVPILDSDLLKNGTEDEHKSILRYGFQQTDACKDFKKAFICVRKCLDYGFEIAEANKNCQCKCYRNRILAAHRSTMKASSVTSWKLGAPTTSRPSWVKTTPGELKPKSDVELFVHNKLHGDSEETDGENSGDGDGVIATTDTSVTDDVTETTGKTNDTEVVTTETDTTENSVNTNITVTTTPISTNNTNSITTDSSITPDSNNTTET